MRARAHAAGEEGALRHAKLATQTFYQFVTVHCNVNLVTFGPEVHWLFNCRRKPSPRHISVARPHVSGILLWLYHRGADVA